MTGQNVVIGVGDRFRRDAGAGRAVVSLLRGRLTAVHLVTCDCEPTTLIDLWSGARLAVVVHAVRAVDGQGGQVHRLSALHPAHSHLAGLSEAVALARSLDLMPASLLLFAVQVDDVGVGIGLSLAVQRAVRRIADEITALVHSDCMRIAPPTI
ncbi:MAG TPA: hydrogenase maturation protease [Pilimelia sp.]|nr:hydrogenase maturation protease [Pilimelia sp.]